MIDPITALSVATAAVGQIKKLLNDGQEIGGALAKFAGAVSDVNRAAEKAKSPTIWKTLTGSAEEEAVQIFAAQKKLQQMRRDVETLISYTYGQKGLDEYKDTLRKVKAERQKNQYRKEEIKDALIFWSVTTVIVLCGFAGLAFVIYFIGKSQGKW
jgi:predicted S18 family serine protease